VSKHPNSLAPPRASAKVVIIRRKSDPYYRPQRVKIIDVEVATPGMDSRNPSGIWFWATYAPVSP